MPAKRLERWYHILRSVPPAQLVRRLQIMVWRRLEARWRPAPPREVPAWRRRLPQPVFAPRLEQWRVEGDRVFLELPWGCRELTLPMEWAPPLASRLDGSWRARLQYMEYLEAADDRWFEALIDDWLQQVTLDRRAMRQFGWRSFNLSIRVVVWLQQVARRRERLPSALLERMRGSLAHQLSYLERFVETDLRGNHLIKNIKAFLWAGHCFEGTLAEHWRQLGAALLARELAEQVLEDGCHYERSPAYHCQVLADFIECRQVLEPGPLRDDLDAIIARMAVALSWLVHPDGRVAQFNDGGLGMAYSPSACIAAAGLADAAPTGVFSLPAAGFFGSRFDDDYLIVDCGVLAPDYLIGHGHGDILAFEWSIAGRRMIVDQGTFQNLSGERRKLSRATASHNTLSIAGLDQGDFYGAHRCGRRPTPELMRFEPLGEGFVLEGRHDGYRHLPGHPVHRRRFEAARDRLVIEDWIEGEGDHAARGGFLLHPDCEVERRGDDMLIRNGEVVLRLRADTPLEIEAAEWYPDLYCALASQRITFEMAKARSVRLVFERLGSRVFTKN